MNPMNLPYGVGSYRRTASRLPEIICRNQYVERAPANLNEQVVLLARPGLVSSYVLGDGPIKALYRQDGALSGAILAVSGTSFYDDETLVDTVDDVTHPEIDATSTTAWIAAGTLYKYDGATLDTEAFPDSADVYSVCVIDQIVVAVRADTGRMYFLLPGDTLWNALDFFSAEEEPDPVIAVRKVGNELWAFGTSTVQPFVSTGDSDTPFEPINGREFLRGCRARPTIAKLDNTVFWVGDDGIVYRGDVTPQRISDHGIEERVAAVSDTDLRAWAYPWKGHTFYALTIGDEGTFVFDVATGEWHEAVSYALDHWRAHVGVTDGLTVYVGDSENGTVGTLSDAVTTDYGAVMERTFTSGLEVDGPTPCDSIELDASAGFGSDTPVIEMRYSGDGGNTFTGWASASLGALGEYRKRVLWRRLGLIDRPGRVFEFRLTDASPWRLSGLRMNASAVGGRSR